jgi:hypothetical protein
MIVNMTRLARISDPTTLEAPQQELLHRARDVLGNLVGTSLSLERDRGWHINLRIMRDISRNERQAINEVVGQFNVPISVTEHKKPPRLFSPRRRGAGDSIKS